MRHGFREYHIVCTLRYPHDDPQPVPTSLVNSETNRGIRQEGISPRIVEYTFSGFYAKKPM